MNDSKSKSGLENAVPPSSRTASAVLQPDEPFLLVPAKRKISQQLERQCTSETPAVQSKIVMTPIGQELVDVEWCDEITVIMPAKRAAELKKLSDLSARAEAKLKQIRLEKQLQYKAKITEPSMPCVKAYVSQRPDPVIEVITLK